MQRKESEWILGHAADFQIYNMPYMSFFQISKYISPIII